MPGHRHSVPERLRRRPWLHLSKLHHCRMRNRVQDACRGQRPGSGCSPGCDPLPHEGRRVQPRSVARAGAAAQILTGLHRSSSAHPYRDPDTGELHAICYTGAVLEAIRLVVVDVQGPDSRSSRFDSWTITPSARSVQRAVIDDHPQEFPRCDERRLGKPYRYAYAVPLAGRGSAFPTENPLIRHGLNRGTRAIHGFGANRYPGEFVFVARGAGVAEDDGGLMGFVIDMATLTTALVLIDGSDFQVLPVAGVTVPHRIPPGFHSNWVGADNARGRRARAARLPSLISALAPVPACRTRRWASCRSCWRCGWKGQRRP
jgi:carotenoid cleavage dioxygenase-like enzyme